MLLEESRIEKNQVQNRPQDQPWIEAAAMAVAVEEYAKMLKQWNSSRKKTRSSTRRDFPGINAVVQLL